MSRTMNDIKEEIKQWLLAKFSSSVVQFEPEEKQIEMVEEFIQEELNMGTNESLVDQVEMDFTAELILEMLTYTNAYLKDNYGDEIGIKVFTVQNIFDTFALIIAYEYQEEIRCSAFDEFRELDEDEEIKNLSDVLEKYVDEETKQKIVQEYLLQLIPVESAI